MKKETEPKYLPKVVLAKLKTATTMDEVRQQLKGQGFTRKEMREQIHPFSCGRYKNDFGRFEKDWKAETYDPGATLAFTDEQAEVLEVLQEEVNNIDTEKLRKEMRKAENVKRDRQRKRRMKARKGNRYRKRYF